MEGTGLCTIVSSLLFALRIPLLTTCSPFGFPGFQLGTACDLLVALVVLVFFIIFVILLIRIFFIIPLFLASEKENSSGDNSLPEVVPDLEVLLQQHLHLLVHISVGVIGKSGGTEEVKEALGPHLLGHGLALILAFLHLLFHLLHRDVLSLLPVDLAPLTFKYLGTLWQWFQLLSKDLYKTHLKTERIIFVRFTLHAIVLSENRVGEKLVGMEVEGEGESHGISFVEGKTDVPQVLQHALVVFANYFHQHFLSLEFNSNDNVAKNRTSPTQKFNK